MLELTERVGSEKKEFGRIFLSTRQTQIRRKK